MTRTTGYELLVTDDCSFVIYRDKFLDLLGARSMLTSVVCSDVYENAFTRAEAVNCRITEVNLTEDEVITLTPPPKAGRSKR